MTKEEVALNWGLCKCDEAYTSRGLRDPDCPWHQFAVEEAMDQYAKQQSIAFSEWCQSNYVHDFEPIDDSLPIAKRTYRQFWVDNDQIEYSTEQLYELFLNQSTK